jgi:hypothetical protein
METMPTIGELLKQCRKASKLRKLNLKDITEVTGRDTGYLSKVENGLKVITFSRSEVVKLAQLFRDNLVPDILVEEFETVAQTARIVSGQVSGEESDVSQMVYETLQELNELEKIGYKKELEVRNYVWHGLHLAIQELDQQGFQLTLQNLQRLEKMEKESTNNIQARLQLMTSRMLRYVGQVKPAETKLNKAVELASDSGDEILVTQTLKERGDFHRRHNQKHLNMSLADYQNAFDIFEKRKDEDRKASQKLRMASIYLTAGLPQKARPICEEVLKYAEIRRKDYLHRKGLEYKAWAMAMLGNLDLAVELQLEAHKFAIRTKEPQEIAKSLTYLGGLYLLCGLVSEAEQAYNDADDHVDTMLNDMKESNDAQELFIRCSTLLGLGDVKRRQTGAGTLARQYLDESLQIAQQLNDQVHTGRSLQLLGELDLKEGALESAQLRFRAARSLFETSGLPEDEQDYQPNPYYISSLELSCAKLALTLENFSDAKSHLEQAKKISGKFGFEELFFTSQLLEARLLIAKDEYFDQQELVNLVHSPIKGALRKGPYLLKVIIGDIDRVLDLAHERNAGLAVETLNILLEQEKQIWSSVKTVGEKQQNTLDNFFRRLRKHFSDWDAMNKVAVLSKQTSP